jgi:hypothetical protein
MGFINDNVQKSTAYVIAFKYKDHANTVKFYADESTRMYLESFNMRNVTSNVETVCGIPSGALEAAGIPHIYADIHARLCISKLINYNNLGCRIEPITLRDYFEIPFEFNVGVVLVKKLVGNTNKQLIFDCEVIDPIRDIDLFRKTLIGWKN